jgi:thiamine-monophosphate kinase
MPLGEFDIISTYFQKQNKRKDVVVGIGDDCAVLSPPVGKNLLVSTDTLNLHQHFFADTPAYDVGYKSVAVSLSDMAAMGGEPAWLLLSLTLPDVDELWLESFAQGLFACLDVHDIALVGGNLTKGPLAITTEILGFGDKMLTRANAKVNDAIYVTGTLGEGGLALALLKNEIAEDNFAIAEINCIKQRLFRPAVRLNEAKYLKQIAHAAIDISDGLLADLQHILDASHVGATIYADKLPLSASLQKVPLPLKTQIALTGGDDYELCFTLPSAQVSQLAHIEQHTKSQFTCIGNIEQQLGLRVITKDGELLSLEKLGYKHFL